MVSRRLLLVGGVVAVAVVGGAAYAMSGNDAGNAKKNYTVAIVTDVGGVDDKSFNQSAWEGLEKWGKSHKLTKGVNGYNYFQSKTQADYATNFQQAVTAKYSMVAGIGYSLHDATVNAAKKNPKTDFVLVDDIDTKKTKNVASVMFRSEQSSYLAGVAAAKTTKTNKLGFVGGMESAVVKTFEAGFVGGAKSVNPDIQVDVQYVGSFTDAGKGKTIAASMYQNGTDVIFSAAGGAGAGVFTEAKDLNSEKNAADKVWVIGVDRDQNDDGAYTAKDGKSNFTLTSSVKKVGKAVVDVTEMAAKDKFPGGKQLVYGLDDKGVAVTRGNMSDEAWQAVQAAQKKIVDKEITVPSK